MISPAGGEHTDVIYGSYGLDQCLDLVEHAMSELPAPKGLSEDWLIGDGIAMTMIDTVPPDGHIADVKVALRDDGGFDLTVGTAEFGNGTSTVHRQIAATALATTVDQVRLFSIRHGQRRSRHRRLRLDRHLRCRPCHAGSRGEHGRCSERIRRGNRTRELGFLLARQRIRRHREQTDAVRTTGGGCRRR